MLRFETFIAARYLRSKRKNRFVSLITLISVAGVSVGVIALIVVMGVMTGFDIELRATIIGNRAHLNVFDQSGSIADSDAMLQEIQKASPDVIAGAPILQIEALLENRSRISGAMILGVNPQQEELVTDLAENLTTNDHRTFGKGELPKEKEIVLGYRLAQQLRATVGSEIAVITAKSTVRPLLGKQNASRLYLRVSGISHAKMSEFDSVYAWVDIPTAHMLSEKHGVDALHFKLTDPFKADQVAKEIEAAFPYYYTETWYENNEAFLGALEQEKLAMFIILTFIILVAAFNITSTLIMIVMEKRRDIGILRTLGASGPSILSLFILEGLMIGLSGTLIGLIGGILLAYNLNPVAGFIAGLFGMDLFNSTIYYFDGIPVAVVPWDVCWITFSAVILTFISTLYPAFSAVRINPVEALRYE